MYNQLKNKIHNNNIFVCMLLIVTVFFLIYVSSASANVVFMDYWRYLNTLVDKMYTTGVTFHDLYSSNGVHRSPVQLFIFLCNVRFFHLNPQIDVYLGAIMLAVQCCILYKEYKKDMNVRQSAYYYLGIAGVILAVFSLGQWEILTTEFSFSAGIGRTLTILSFFWTNRLLKKMEGLSGRALELALLYVFIICGVKGMFFLGYGCALVVIIIWDFLQRSKEEKRKYFKTYIILGVGLLCGAILYLYGLDMGSSNGGTIHGLSFATVISLLKSYIIMMGASMIGTAAPAYAVEGCGIFLSLFTIYCIFVYFNKQFYKNTYFPMLLIISTIAIVFVIWVGRGERFNIWYLASSRYICDTKMMMVADIWIMMLYLQTKQMEKKDKKEWVKCIANIGLVIVMLSGIIITDKMEWDIKGYRKAYYNQIIEKMRNIDSLKEEEFANFQANNPDMVREGVAIMKKYKLNIYYYED